MSNLTTALMVTLILGLFPADDHQALPPEASILVDELTLSALTDDAAEMLDEIHVVGSVDARVKSPESLAAKAVRKGMPEADVLDRVGLRVRVETEAECYAVLEAIHDRFPQVVGAQDDYIARPKANGYQSLHTAVLTPLGVAEFQVRTHAMHHHAEHGGAAHAGYKASQRAV